MSRCPNCKVEILDEVQVCPLCHSVLEKGGSDTLEPKEPWYPDISPTMRWLSFVMKLYSFLAILLGVGLVAINYFWYPDLWWSVISGIIILDLYITLRFFVVKSNAYQGLMLLQTLAIPVLTIAIDFIFGYHGWSVNYVIPSTILLLDLAVLILMIANRGYWHSYISFLVLTVLLSGICLLLLWRGVITFAPLVIMAVFVSAFFFIGTLIFGDRRAKGELKRRFHV